MKWYTMRAADINVSTAAEVKPSVMQACKGQHVVAGCTTSMQFMQRPAPDALLRHTMNQ